MTALRRWLANALRATATAIDPPRSLVITQPIHVHIDGRQISHAMQRRFGSGGPVA